MDNLIHHSAIALISSPIGGIEIQSEGGFITSLVFTDEIIEEAVPESLSTAVHQVKQYFEGRLKAFDLPLSLKGTVFQRAVWNLLLDIPYGQITTYGEISAKLGLRNGARAVGLANGSNPVSIIVPCHRVIGQGQKLTGYGGGLWRKEWLLKMESGGRQLSLFKD